MTLTAFSSGTGFSASPSGQKKSRVAAGRRSPSSPCHGRHLPGLTEPD